MVRGNLIRPVVWLSLLGALLSARAAERLVQPPLIRGEPIKRSRAATNAPPTTGNAPVALTDAAAVTSDLHPWP